MRGSKIDENLPLVAGVGVEPTTATIAPSGYEPAMRPIHLPAVLAKKYYIFFFLLVLQFPRIQPSISYFEKSSNKIYLFIIPLVI